MDINEDLHRQFTNILTKFLDVLITQEQESLRVNNCLINYTGPSLKNIKHLKYIHLG